MWPKLKPDGNSKASLTTWLRSVNTMGLKTCMRSLLCLLWGIITYQAAYFTIADTRKQMLPGPKDVDVFVCQTTADCS